jgi:hypothetical protein
MLTLKTTKSATLLWMERGQTPTEAEFRSCLIASHISQHYNIQSAICEAMRRLVNGSSEGRQPWILSQGIILEPEEIQMIHSHSTDPMEAVLRY